MSKVARFLVPLVVLSACGSPRSDDSVTGRVSIDGSSTAFPILEAFAEEFQLRHRRTKVTVGISGSAGGFQRLCSGQIDVASASRAIRGREIEACAQAQVRFSGFPIARDGVTLVTHPSNTFVECLTTDELRSIWQPDSSVRTWRDVRSVWPDEEIRFYTPGTDSGTFQYFTEIITGQAGASRADVQASENDNVLVRGIAGDPGGFGYFGYGYYARHPAELRLIAVDDGSGCVLPSRDAIGKGLYAPLSRPLYVYLNHAALEREAVRLFVEEMLAGTASIVDEVGYVPLTDAEYETAAGVVGTIVNGG